MAQYLNDPSLNTLGAGNVAILGGQHVPTFVVSELNFLREVDGHPNLYGGPVVKRAIKR